MSVERDLACIIIIECIDQKQQLSFIIDGLCGSDSLVESYGDWASIIYKGICNLANKSKANLYMAADFNRYRDLIDRKFYKYLQSCGAIKQPQKMFLKKKHNVGKLERFNNTWGTKHYIRSQMKGFALVAPVLTNNNNSLSRIS